MANLPHDLFQRLLKMIPRLGADSDGEALNAVRAMGRTLSARGFDFCDFSEAVSSCLRSSPLLPAPGRQRTSWETALWCRDHDDGRLPAKDREFLRAIIPRLARGRSLSAKQLAWLDDIYTKLQGGRWE